MEKKIKTIGFVWGIWIILLGLDMFADAIFIMRDAEISQQILAPLFYLIPAIIISYGMKKIVEYIKEIK